MPHSGCSALHGVNRKCRINLFTPCLLLIITLLSFVVKGKFGQTSKNLKILWPWLKLDWLWLWPWTYIHRRNKKLCHILWSLKLDNKTMWNGFWIHFQLLNSCFQLLIIAAKHSVHNETGFLDQFWHLAFAKVNNCFYSQFFFFFIFWLKVWRLFLHEK